MVIDVEESRRGRSRSWRRCRACDAPRRPAIPYQGGRETGKPRARSSRPRADLSVEPTPRSRRAHETPTWGLGEPKAPPQRDE
ncbi:hypothetical protein GWI33_019601 [Rhynchophorus ferrugineus]|uniref:Uncharacterized protein n=1 Tax=Rhynchophorus ferrugineus TaxID=354439 RepID=A0A834M6U3_RHYFE|nr:hypothetical protein GWI33_019601 [Rhynchophorus ferrugineus]